MNAIDYEILLRGSPDARVIPPDGMNLLTPMLPGRGYMRIRLFVSDKDHAKTAGERGKRWTATVTDIPTGRRFKVRAASCGIPTCFCAARIVEVVP